MSAKTVPDFNLLALKIPQVLFLTRTSPSFFSSLELGLQSCRLEKQPNPGVCIHAHGFSRRGLFQEGTRSPASTPTSPGGLEKDVFSPNTKHAVLWAWKNLSAELEGVLCWLS